MPGKKIGRSRKEEKGEKGGRKRGAKRRRGFTTHIYRLIKLVHGKNKVGVSSKGMAILTSFANEMLDRIAREAAVLVQHGKRDTMGTREVAAAVRLVIPGELGRNAVLEGVAAVEKYAQSKEEGRGGAR